MLKQLNIQNLALINKMNLAIYPGLTIITGETGAGKSILIQAIEALLGEPVGSESVQTGASLARVEGSFELDLPPSERQKLEAMDLIMDNEGEIILTREIHRKGRDRFLVNDQIIRKADFQWLGHQLLDVNSQHSHQYLLKTKNHQQLFDNVVRDQEIYERVKNAWLSWNQSASDWHSLKQSVDAMEKRRQLIEYQMQEIDDAKLNRGEKEALIGERERLRYAEDIRSNLNEAFNLMEQEPGLVADNTARIAALVQKAAGRDSRLDALAEQAELLSVTSRDLSHEIIKALDNVTASPERLNEVSDRLYLLQQLEGKFHNSIEGILEYREQIEQEYGMCSSEKKQLENLEKTCEKARSDYAKLDSELSEHRQKTVPGLSRSIEKALSELGMRHARFSIQIDSDWQLDESEPAYIVPDRCTAYGTDKMEFLISANPGVPLKPLSQIASGGELSRVMLALKQFLFEESRNRTMVFDEVDSGIGGDVANAVGAKLRMLSQSHKILCVTHLPQIAIRGHHHILVDKQTDGNTTTVQLIHLDAKQRIHEIARMLGGKRSDLSAMKHAETMLSSITDQ